MLTFSKTGIIVGMLYDSNTPYVWTQEMRTNFKYTSLLTSQSIFHGLAVNDPECQRHVQAYLRDGYVSFSDGQVCGGDAADLDSFGSLFGLDSLAEEYGV